MIETVNQHDFTEAFRRMGRNDQFSYDGQRALFDYLEEYEDGTGEQVELDVIALCCDYSEHDSAVDCINDMGYDFDVIPKTCPDCGEGVYFESDMYGTTAEIKKQVLDLDEMICPDCGNDVKDEMESSALDYLTERTPVITFDTGIIIQGF